MGKSNVPEVRFEGFDGEWENKKLEAAATSFDYGLNAAARAFDGTNKYIRITDIDDETRTFKTDSLTTPDCDIATSENYVLQEGDILFARTGASVGKSYLYQNTDGLVYFAGFLIRARIKATYSPEFVFQNTLTHRYQNYILVTSQRSGQPGVNAKEYSNYSFFFPLYDEQTQIGDFFKQLDESIALHQQELESLKQTKQGFLQKMFPQAGETVPALRFLGFSGAWEEKRLGEILVSHAAKPYIVESQEYGNFPVLQQGDNPRLGYSDSIPFLNYYEVVLFGDHTLSIHKPSEPFLLATDGVKIISLKGLENYFSYVILQKFKPESQGYKRHLSILKNESVTHPTDIKEQTLIGNFFKQLDETINLKERELANLKQTKQGFLQKMFV